MAATIIGTIATNAYVLKQRTGTQNRFGLISIRETWLINAVDLFNVIPAFQTVHPEFAYLFVQEATFDYMGTALCRVNVTYEGANLNGGGGGPPATTPFYALQTGTMSLPIVQHPSITTWIGTETTAGRNPRDSAGLFKAWQLGAESSGGQALYGIDNYDYPTAIWSKEWVSSVAPDAADLARLGHIDTPEGSPPTVSNANWLCIEMSYRDIGAGMVQRTERWKLSQSNPGGGWNSDVY